MVLGLFADNEPRQRHPALPGQCHYGTRYGVGTDRHPTYRLRRGRQPGNPVKNSVTDEVRRLGIQCQFAAIQVIGRLLSRSQCELTEFQSLVANQFNQSLFINHEL